MTISVPSWIAATLHIAETFDGAEALQNAVGASIALLGIENVTVDDLISALSSDRYVEVEFVPIVNKRTSINWRFSELSVNATRECVLIEVGSSLDGVIPTSSMWAMLLAWFFDKNLTPAELCKHHATHVMVGWFIEKPQRKLVLELCVGIAGLESPETVEDELSLWSASTIDVAPTSLMIREPTVYAGLLQSAIKNRASNLRFLYLYRLFERAYLIDAMDNLQATFFEDPDKSIKAAQRAVANEISSFISVVGGSPARDVFVEIERAFSANDATLANKFMIAVKKGAEDDEQLNHPDAWKRGCVLAYKVRCSIVHSGKSAPIYESFFDATAACRMLNEIMERAAIGFLRVSS